MTLKTDFNRVRLYVDEPLQGGAAVDLDSSQTHYLVNVLRMRKGARLCVFNGRDGEWIATIAESGKRQCRLHIDEILLPQSGVPDIWLLFAPVKKIRLDFLVQKATELGVSLLRPVITRRTNVARVNLDRMAANAIEAAEQSGRLSVPEIVPPARLEAILTDWPADRQLFFCDEDLGGSKSGSLEVLKAAGASGAILIGPEGGFDSTERATLQNHASVKAIGLGPRIMRADTAAMAALSLWQAVQGDW